jgi:hypothetical protein
MGESGSLRWDGGPDEKTTSGQFLREINIKIEDKEYTTDKKKIDCFRNNLDFGGTADQWLDGLADDIKSDWDKLVEAFEKQWPKNTIPKPSKAERIRELKEWTLAVETLGTKTETAGSKEVWTHIKWANGLLPKAKDADDTNGLLLQDVFDSLPAPIRDLIRHKSRTTYEELADTVRGIDVVHLRETVAKYEKDEETARLARITASPTKNLREALTNTHIHHTSNPPQQQTTTQHYRMHPTRGNPPDPFITNMGGRGSLFAGRGLAPRSYRGGPEPTNVTRHPSPFPSGPTTRGRPIAARYQDLQNLALPQHPDTDAGRAAHRTQVDEWHRINGNTQPDELHPYPLSPGTAPAGSRECWDCGQAGHRAAAPVCRGVTLSEHERTWRRIASHIARESWKERQAQNVNYVSHGHQGYDGFDNHAHEYGGYFYSNNFDDTQGNGRGPSA